MTDVRDFLSRVLPWPGPENPGHIGLHVQMKIDGSTRWTGYPCATIEEFEQNVRKVLTWKTTPDIYVCMSRQAKTKTNAKGREVAAKSQADALALKSIFLDVDVKPTSYATVQEALDEAVTFCDSIGIPYPTAYVSSGGGLHLHWISQVALLPQVWQVYADGLKNAAIKHGLKIDAAVTSDSARVLRVPGTYNLKQEPRRPVLLKGLQEDDYDFETDLAVLKTFAGNVSYKNGHAGPSVLPGGPSAKFLHLPIESLAEGINREPQPPLKFDPIAEQCGWIREALLTGGKDFSQGEWNLSTLVATFLEDGHELAHKMAEGHDEYSYDETEALWGRKQTERETLDLGWPRCSSIKDAGSKHCEGCSLFDRGKSPLNVLPVQPLSLLPTPFKAEVGTGEGGTISATLVPVVTSDLPYGYIINPEGQVCKVIKNKKGETRYPVVLRNRLYNPWLQKGPDALMMITSADRGHYRSIQLTFEDIGGAHLVSLLMKQAVVPSVPYVKEFLMDFVSKLQEAAAAQICKPFGWTFEGAVCTGFSYGGTIYKTDGSQAPAGQIDPIMRSIYTPQGEKQKWLDVFRLIINQHRPGLECIVASGFAAPLMFATGQYSVFMSVFGDTGAGKSTAASLATAIWGKPQLAKDNDKATVKSVFHKLGQLRALPYYWDEIKNEDSQKKAHDVLYNATLGSEGDRLTSSIQHREKGTWQTIVGLFSNPAFTNYVIKSNLNTSAGLMRVFEWKETIPAKNAPGQISNSKAAVMVGALDLNYGLLGREWAAVLGPNRELIQEAVERNAEWFQRITLDKERNTNDERFWIAFAAVILTAAELTNIHLGLGFNVNQIRQFLAEKLREQRRRRVVENLHGGSLDHTEDTLTQFLKTHARYTVRTREGAYRGRGTPQGVEFVGTIPDNYGIQVQWVLDEAAPQLRISKRQLEDWLRQNGGDPSMMRDSLTSFFSAKLERGILARGTHLRAGREWLYIIPVQYGSALENMMTGDANGKGLDSKPRGEQNNLQTTQPNNLQEKQESDDQFSFGYLWDEPKGNNPNSGETV